jgi:hypothetical protein
MVPMTRWPVSLGADGHLDRLEVAEFADDDDVGVLAEGALERGGEGRVCGPTSRWVTLQPLAGCTTSMGSSTVMMWSCASR